MISTQEEDKRLLERICRNDKEAFRQLYRQYADATYQVALAVSSSVEVAQDAVQDVFARLFRQPRLFYNARNIKTYLLVACRNAAVNSLRKTRRHETSSLETLSFVAEANSEEINHDDIQQLNRFLTELPAQQREVIVLKVYQELTFREIGAVQGVSLSTVLSRYEYGMNKLKEKFRHA